MSAFGPEFDVSVGGKLLYTPSSQTYYDFHADEQTPNILLFGRRGTGKSWAVRWQLHLLALKYPGFRYMVCRNHKTELERTHLRFIGAEMEALGGSFAAVKGETTYFDSKGTANGSTGVFVGFEREADALKVLGADLDVLVIEEITTMSWAVVVDLQSCLRSTTATGRVPQLIAPTNPFGPHAIPIKRHWVTQDISQDEEPGYDPADWLAIATYAADNPHLNFTAYDKRLGALTPAKRKAWLAGEWASSEGAFFAEFMPQRDGQPWHVIDRLPNLDGDRTVLRDCPIYRAIDWGFADDPAVCLWIAVLPNGRAIVVKERSWKRTPVVEVAHEIIGHSAGMRVVQTFCDPTMRNGSRVGAESVADIFEKEGVPLTDSINDRSVPMLHEYLSSTLADGGPRVQMWAEGCPTLIRTLPEQTGNTTHPERMADSRTDHHTLTLSYFTAGGVKDGHLVQPVKKIPKWMHHGSNRPKLGAESVRNR